MYIDDLTRRWNRWLEISPIEIQDYLGPLANLQATTLALGFATPPNTFFEPEDPTNLLAVTPSFKQVNEGILLALRKHLYVNREPELTAAWAEKLLRFIEIRQVSLAKIARDKYGSVHETQLNMLHLASFLLDFYQFSQDARYLNTVLKMVDQSWIFRANSLLSHRRPGRVDVLCSLLQLRLEIQIEQAMRNISAEHTQPPALAEEKENTDALAATDYQPPIPPGELPAQESPILVLPAEPVSPALSSVIIFSPSRYSLYTLVVAWLFLQQGVKINAIVVRKLTNPSRFIFEYQRDGARLVRKIIRKLLLRRRAYPPEKLETISAFMKTNNIQTSSLAELSKQYHIPLLFCEDLNDPPVQQLLHDQRPALVVFTGGGLIRQDVLQAAGVVNCHMGVLPLYRGMDVVEWSLLEGHRDQIGLTVHFMDVGLDTGDILTQERITPRPGEPVQQLRDRIEARMAPALVNSCLEHLAGGLPRQPQRLEDGKQYFVMHPRLLEITREHRLRQ